MLYQDGVMAAADSPVTREWLTKATEGGEKVHVLREELSGRGITEPMEGIDVIDCTAWVDLVEEFQPVSW